MGYKRETLDLLIKFRKNMGSDLYQEDARRIFRATLPNLKSIEINPESEKKLQYARSFINSLQVFNLVKFIGVTGSTAANTAKDDDDIDVIVVVKNNTLWIYRGLMLVKNIFNSRFRRANNPFQKDLLCVNLIAEERGLKFENDIFTLHELFWIKPIYNEDYLETILSSNQWLKEWGGVVGKMDYSIKNFNFFIEAINLYFAIPQIIFMLIAQHNPDLNRIFHNYLKGRIEFFSKEFKKEKINLL